MLNQLAERRDSSTSTISSAYTVSRRSSGISPYFSSRRSSEASQFGNRPNNTSSADSYDPISTDASRRSSDASQCSGIPGLLNLTPAQHYRLKAKYAAATGGPPPTPLPNMERMSLKNRIFLLDGSEPALPSFRLPPGPRRCSDSNAYGLGASPAFPLEVTGNHARRASDPVRRLAGDPTFLPRVHHFNSTNNMNPLYPSVDRRNINLPSYTRSDGSLARHVYSPRPPSISENIAMEAMAGEAEGDDDIVLPDDVVQYLKSQTSGMVADNSSIGYSDEMPNFQVNAKGQHNNLLSQLRTALPDASMNHHTAPVMGGCQMNFGASSSVSKNSMPVQWNEVSSGTVDATSAQAKQPFPQRNLAVVHQKQNFGQYQNFSHQQMQLGQNNMNTTLQQPQFVQKNAGMDGPRLNCMHLRQQQVNPGPSNNPGLNTHEGYNQVHQMLSPNTMTGELCQLSPSCSNMIAKPSPHVHPQQTGIVSDPASVVNSGRECIMHNQVMQESGHQQGFSSQPNHMNLSMAHPSTLMTSNQPNFEPQQDMIGTVGQSCTPGVVQPHPPPNPSPANRHRGIRAMQPLGYMRTPHPPSHVSPGQERAGATPRRTTGVASAQPQQCNSSMRENHLMHYYGQIHMYEQNGHFGNHADCSIRQQHCALNIKPATMPSPGANQVSSTVDSQVLEPPQIDFDAIMDDGDHSSLMSGTLSPSILQNLSQNSSRLTTPRNSLTLPSIPAGISNMAIGDMSSMLTTLAEESKFLNMMS